MSVFGYSQNDYPKVLIIEGDTVCAITLPQMDTALSAFIYLEECQEIQDALKAQVRQQEHALLLQGTKIFLLEKDSAAQSKINIELRGQIKASDEQVARLQLGKKGRNIALVITTTAAAIFGVLYFVK